MCSRIGSSVLGLLISGGLLFAHSGERAEAGGPDRNQEQRSTADTTEIAASVTSVETHRLLSVAENAVLGGYRASLATSAVREASLEHVLRQLARNPPVAFVDGYWATPIDLAAVLESPPIRDGLPAMLPASPAGEEASTLLADKSRLKQLAAVAFTPDPLRVQAGLPYVGELRQATEVAAEATGVFVVPVRDVDWSLVEYLPPPPAPGGEAECYFFCGDAATWDFDGDGTPDVRDQDDDNDGTPDERDDYPYWPAATSCECAAEVFVVLVTKSAVSIRNAVLAAYTILAGLDGASTGVTLGSVGAQDTLVQLVLPAALMPLEQRPDANDCPRADAPGVSYISTDPDDCAVLRFRCAAHRVAFTNHCGCGCVDEATR